MFKTLGEALFARGFRRSVWVSFDDIRVREFGTFDPGAPLLDFPRRYGSAKRKGDLVGERFAAFLLEEVIRHPSNPLGLDGNQSYALRPGEEYDVRMVSTGGDTAVYDGLILPLHLTLFPRTVPTGPTKPDPTKPDPTKPDPTKPDPAKPDPAKPDPAKPDPAKPDPGKPPVSSVEQRAAELRSLLADALSGFKVAWAKAGIERFVASEFVGLALRRAVELYRKVMG